MQHKENAYLHTYLYAKQEETLNILYAKVSLVWVKQNRQASVVLFVDFWSPKNVWTHFDLFILQIKDAQGWASNLTLFYFFATVTVALWIEKQELKANIECLLRFLVFWNILWESLRGGQHSSQEL